MEKANVSSPVQQRTGQKPLISLSHLPYRVFKRVARLVEQAVAWAYGQPQARWQPALMHSLYSLNAAVRLVTKKSRGRIYLCQGVSKISGEPMTVQFIGEWKVGEDNSLAYFEHLLFQPGSVERSDLGACSPDCIRQVAHQAGDEVDLIAILANPLLLWIPAYGDWVVGPPDVRMVYDFPQGEDWSQIQHRLYKQQEYNFRVLRRNGLTARNSRREKDLRLFYECMYLPFVINRYKEHADAVGYEYARRIFEKPGGSVLLIEAQEGKPIAGGLEQVSNGVLYALINGVIDGDYDWVKKGAMTAWYSFEIQRAFELGCRRYDAGLARPFVNDGLYIHKHRWGLKPVLNYWKPQKILFWAPNSSPAALAWLNEQLFLPRFAHAGGPNLHRRYQTLAQAPVD